MARRGRPGCWSACAGWEADERRPACPRPWGGMIWRLGLRRLAGGLAALAVLATAQGCGTADPYIDARIEAEVKARLVAQHDADLTRLGVVSNDGTVYLTGAVPSSAQKARASNVAGTVSGVGKVVNALDVRPGRD